MKHLSLVALAAMLVVSTHHAAAAHAASSDATASASAPASADPGQIATPAPVQLATAEPAQLATAEPAPLTTSPAPSAVPVQPTIPDSMLDPSVLGRLAHPITELSQFRWMLGTWQGHAVAELGSGRSHDNGRDTYVFAATMRGRWIFGADGRGADYFYLTFDPFARRWVLVRFNDNPAYGIWMSPGWHQNTIVFTSNYSYVNGRQYRRRITFIRKDERTFGIYDEEQKPDGSWTPDESAELERPR